jgi:hypothetical protein
MKNPKPQPELGVIIIGDTELLRERLTQMWAESVIAKAKQEEERKPCEATS